MKSSSYAPDRGRTALLGEGKEERLVSVKNNQWAEGGGKKRSGGGEHDSSPKSFTALRR
jgi:hypothetical protein